MATIEITVSPRGETRVETRGFVGDACRKASEFLERALGKAVSDEPTAEFHLAPAADVRPRLPG